MPSFPIPVFVACILAYAALRLWRQRGAAGPLVALLALCAAQSLVIALNQHYGLAAMRPVQPLLAGFIPPVAWLAFRGGFVVEDALHLLGPLAAGAALAVAPQFLDVLLPGLFVLYGALILLSANRGADAQPNALLASGDLPARIWLVIGVALIASALSDVLIIISQAAGYPGLRPWIISVFSVGNLLVIGALSLSPHLTTLPEPTPRKSAAPPSPDPELWARVEEMMASKRPYLDPDLTLARLARKLGVPVKSLSATINQATGENVSRYINAARIAEAQQAMAQGESVTNAMLAAGFNTKSNFNREFLRVTGQSPSAWLTQHASAQAGP